ncbi:TonB-denpendent receptor [Komagataeibacter intermedius AF2]|uniref:TonB-denpendent receptor n=2 Tax=Acetobacteraceae TaxID=433 RepID=A0A0N1FCS3_9PROT|nr:TonB-denpendent receptor [Komagataeibacter intermedius AF2]
MKVSYRNLSLCCTIWASLVIVPAYGQVSAATRNGSVNTSSAKTRAKPPTSAAQTTAAPMPAPKVEHITVSRHIPLTANGVTNLTPGGGLMPPQTAPRSQSGLTRDFIAKQAPTANIAALVADLPGVNFSSQDPFGLTGNNMTMRGMTQAQIGYLFEGAPMADPINYQPYSSMMVDSENLGSVTVSQGSPDLDAPLYNAVGGQITATEINPSHKQRGFVDLAGGTHSANKEFIRYETGDIGNTGIRGFVSFSHTSYNNWRGPGGLFRYHIDSKFVKEWGDGNSISAIFSFNRQQQTSWRSPTLSQWNKYGDSFNYAGSFTQGDPTFYGLQITNMNAETVILPSHFTLTKNLKLHVTPYFEHQFGPSNAGESIPTTGGYMGTQRYDSLVGIPTGNGSVLTEGVDPWDQKSGSLNMSLDWTRGHNKLSVGYWYNYTSHQELSTFRQVYADGSYSNSPIIDATNGRILTGYDLNFKQQVNTLFIADTLNLLHDRLTLSAGFRAAMVSRTGTNNVPGADPYYKAGNYFEPLPQFAASFKITPHDQIFVNGTTAFRAPASVEAYSQIFDPNNSHAVEQPGSLKPEYSIGEEIGFRHSGFVNVAVSLFNLNMTNHQVTSMNYIPGTTQLISEPINIGGQTSRGIQAEIGLRRWHHISPYFSGQYLHATMDNNYNAGGGNYLPTAGKIAVESPKFTGAIGLNYDDGRFFGNFALRYVDSQYTTFMDDEKIPSYITSDITLGYRMKKLGPAKAPQIQLNIMNIGDNHYLSGGSSFTSNAHPVNTVAGGLYKSSTGGASTSAPIYLVGGAFAAMVSVSAGF